MREVEPLESQNVKAVSVGVSRQGRPFVFDRNDIPGGEHMCAGLKINSPNWNIISLPNILIWNVILIDNFCFNGT
jgi:hypothetical protein